MITREQFGPYLLLKKLSEDPLGETFRAGLMGRSAMERVVLLRVFNGSALEGQDLWPLVEKRREVHQALRSPNIGSGVGLDQVQGVPYAAYDYISGKNLAQVFEQVVKGNHPVPVEHALLVAERLALGLAVAYETRIESERVLHGFLVPQLVLLSNEGEIRLLGFDIAPGLRQLATRGPLREAFGRFLSPESLAGEQPAKTDDVYSLGAILLQLLLGRQLPAPESDAYQNLILEITQRGLDEVGYLLGRSLSPAEERIPDVVTWHKALSKILIEGQYKATTFNLAFFMHNLFRDEIEKETQEIEVERTIKIPTPQPPAADAGGEGPDLVEALARGELADSPLETRPVIGTGVRSAAKKRRFAWWIPAAAILLLALGVGGYFAWDRYLAPRTAEPEADSTQLAASTPPPADLPVGPPEPTDLDPLATPETEEALTAEEEEPAGPTPEEILERIDSIVSDRTRSMEQSLRAQYDEEIAALRAQLEAARQAQLEAQRRAERPPSRPPQATPAGPISPPASRRLSTTTTPTSAQSTPPTPQAADASTRSGEPPSQTAPATRPETTASTEQSTPTTRTRQPPPTAARPSPPPPSSRTPTRQTATPTQATPSGLPQRAAPKPRVRRGDLVPLGPGVTPPKIEGRIEPRYPVMAQKLKKEATIFVTVLVDENGRVADAKLTQDEKVGFGFEEAALQAARRARFEPARKDGVVVKTWMNLKIDFRIQ